MDFELQKKLFSRFFHTSLVSCARTKERERRWQTADDDVPLWHFQVSQIFFSDLNHLFQSLLIVFIFFCLIVCLPRHLSNAIMKKMTLTFAIWFITAWRSESERRRKKHNFKFNPKITSLWRGKGRWRRQQKQERAVKEKKRNLTRRKSRQLIKIWELWIFLIYGGELKFTSKLDLSAPHRHRSCFKFPFSLAWL